MAHSLMGSQGLGEPTVGFCGAAGNKFLSDQRQEVVPRELQQVIKEKNAAISGGLPTHYILTHMIAKTDPTGRLMPDHEITDEVMGLLVAGFSTPTTALTFLIKFNGERPQVFEKIRVVLTEKNWRETRHTTNKNKKEEEAELDSLLQGSSYRQKLIKNEDEHETFFVKVGSPGSAYANPAPSPEASVITFISARVSDLILAPGVPPSRVRPLEIFLRGKLIFAGVSPLPEAPTHTEALFLRHTLIHRGPLSEAPIHEALSPRLLHTPSPLLEAHTHSVKPSSRGTHSFSKALFPRHTHIHQSPLPEAPIHEALSPRHTLIQ
ncbi:hypothetical protein LguiA_023504 [Lonicera macranthoides]